MYDSKTIAKRWNTNDKTDKGTWQVPFKAKIIILNNPLEIYRTKLQRKDELTLIASFMLFHLHVHDWIKVKR